MPRRSIDRDECAGVVMAGGFGIAWTFWAASGLSGAAATAARIVATIVGVLIVVSALVQRGAGGEEAPPTSDTGSMFGSRGYLLWVAAEVVALFAGNAVLGATGHGDYVAAWTAFVVGVHFLGFGRLFTTMFYWLGAAFVVAAVVGATAGLINGSRPAVEASTGLIAAASLFTAGAWRILVSRSPDVVPTAR